MWRFMLVVVAVGSTACESVDLDYCAFFTAGMCVIDESGVITPGQVEIVVTVVEEIVNAQHPYVLNLPYALEKADTRVEFVLDPMAENCEPIAPNMYRCSRGILGFNEYIPSNPSKTRIVVYAPVGICLGGTALAHELLHSVGREYMNDEDGNHDLLGWFYEHYGKQSLEYQAEQIAVKRLECFK